MSRVTLFLFSSAFFLLIHETVNACPPIMCAPIGDCNGKNQEIRTVICCPVCFTILQKGESCNASSSSRTICAKGLVCFEGVCTSVDDVKGKGQ